MFVDAHFHADDLLERDPRYLERYGELGVVGLASVHDEAGLEASKRALAGLPHLLSFGLHPQLPVMDEAGALEEAAAAGAIDAVGECGFDFYNDANGLSRTTANESAERAVFEVQLELAERRGLPVVLHLRASMDLAFEYARRLARLKAVIFHSWPGPANEALSMLERCPLALFSFGGSMLNGNKKVRAAAAALPLSALLTETDAPFQPPRAAPVPGAPVLRPYSTVDDIVRVAGELAALRGITPEAMVEAVYGNFTRVFDHGFRR